MQDIRDVKNKVIQASLSLAAVEAWGDITIYKIAQKADLDQADVHALFEDKNAILAAYGAQVDAQVSDNLEGQLSADDSDRDRLFDVLMERFDILNENRDAVMSILNTLTLDPKQAVLSLPYLCQSLNKMLVIANIDTGDFKGAVKVAALVALYLKVLKTWIKDESADLSATMASLDQALIYFEKI